MTKKSYNEKLNDSKSFPKIEDLSKYEDYVARTGKDKMLIAAPLQYNEIMAKVPTHKIITADKIREYLSKPYGDNVITCHLTAGIFINIAAFASIERDDNRIPYWRTTKKDGELNSKFPGGIENHKLLLEAEGHEIIQKGKRFFVKDYDKKLWKIKL